MGVGTNAENLSEPEVFWLPFAKRSDARSVSQQPPLGHANGWRELSRVRLVTPQRAAPSPELQAVLDAGVVGLLQGDDYCLDIGVDGETSGKHADLRPELPMVLRW
jgi:hypothetical protein